MSIFLPYSTKAATSAGRVASVFNLLLLQSLWKARWFSAASCQHPLFGRSTAAGAYTDEFVHFNGQAVGYIDNTGGQTYHIVNDHLGSARVMTSTTGVTKFDADYYPQGTPRVVTGTKDVVLKFQGKQLDTESGLANARRMYSPTLARLLTTRVAAVPPKPARKKPVPAPQSLNPGSLAASNPVTKPNSLISSFINLFAPGGIGTQNPAPCAFYFSVGDEMEHGVCGFEGPPDPIDPGDLLQFPPKFQTCTCTRLQRHPDPKEQTCQFVCICFRPFGLPTVEFPVKPDLVNHCGPLTVSVKGPTCPFELIIERRQELEGGFGRFFILACKQ
jgi:hypothetical protein